MALLSQEDSVLMVIDMQGNLYESMQDKQFLLENVRKLVRGMQVFGIPVIVTEQIPEKIGLTIAPVAELLPGAPRIPKSDFSCCGDEKIMKCPAKNYRPGQTGNYRGWHYPYPEYGLNRWLTNCCYRLNGRVTYIKRPSEIVSIADSCHGQGEDWRHAHPEAPGSWSSSPRKCDAARQATTRPEWMRHLGNNNFGFVESELRSSL